MVVTSLHCRGGELFSTLPGRDRVVLKSVYSGVGKFCGPMLTGGVPEEIDSKLLAQAK